MKRRRKSAEGQRGPARKRQRLDQRAGAPFPRITHPVLSCYYPRVCTLREHLLSRLGRGSNGRKRLLESDPAKFATTALGDTDPAACEAVIRLLDTTLVGVPAAKTESVRDGERAAELFDFTQHSSASTAGTAVGRPTANQSEIVDYAIWRLFSRVHKSEASPAHLLCHGMNRVPSTFNVEIDRSLPRQIPGLVEVHANEHVQALKSSAWNGILRLLGRGKEGLMIDLLIDCGVYSPIEGYGGNFYQQSGVPLSEIKEIDFAKQALSPMHANISPGAATKPVKTAEIRFSRTRLLYAMHVCGAERQISLGLSRKHVFNRYADARLSEHTRMVLRYMFPKQHGLSNVFDSKDVPASNNQFITQSMFREEEVAGQPIQKLNATPRRLRGKAFQLICRVQRRSATCSYTKMLDYYCPILKSREGIDDGVEAPHTHADHIEQATPTHKVSAFCKATICKIFPKDLLGEGDVADYNLDILLRHVDSFVRGRRYESITLASVMDSMKITQIGWLRPPMVDAEKPVSSSDHQKRRELLAELLYFIFDSFVTTLIRSNFYVTEAHGRRNRLFFFRHDVWQEIAEPAMRELRESILERVDSSTALAVLEKRTMAASQIRLMPKNKGFRPINNLRRRTVIIRDGVSVLSRSINSILKPVYNALSYEKERQQHRLGSSLFSVGGIYRKLCAFKAGMAESSGPTQKLYFAKVDVRACFDTIPQSSVAQLAVELLSAQTYQTSRHAEFRPPDMYTGQADIANVKPRKVFRSNTTAEQAASGFRETVAATHARFRRDCVFVDSVVPKQLSVYQAAELIREHILRNIVKIGRNYYRQKCGIPQGSVLSSLICNFFYGDFEGRRLDFLRPEESLLFRLIDDFLLITTNAQHAVRFLDIMHAGDKAYGITVRPDKSLANFTYDSNGYKIATPSRGSKFPYCGMLIDTQTLDISRDTQAMEATADSLTVEYSKRPGQGLRRKALSLLKVQIQSMLLDTRHNSPSTVFENVFQALLDTAGKTAQYIQALQASRRVDYKLLIRTVQDTAALAYAMAQSRRNEGRQPTYRCSISQCATRWLTASAFLHVFETKHTRLGLLLRWLEHEVDAMYRRMSKSEARLGCAAVAGVQGRLASSPAALQVRARAAEGAHG